MQRITFSILREIWKQQQLSKCPALQWVDETFSQQLGQTGGRKGRLAKRWPSIDSVVAKKSAPQSKGEEKSLDLLPVCWLAPLYFFSLSCSLDWLPRQSFPHKANFQPALKYLSFFPVSNTKTMNVFPFPQNRNVHHQYFKGVGGKGDKTLLFSHRERERSIHHFLGRKTFLEAVNNLQLDGV